MHYLIDGHNLIARIADIDLSDPDDEAQLILRLKRWTAVEGRHRVTVYFDRGLPGGRDPHFSGGAVEVIFTPSGKAADDLLISHIRRVHNPPEFTLVSSDRQVVSAAESRRMPVLDSQSFAERMASDIEARQRPQPQRSPEEEPLVSPEEVAQWLELFGPEPDDRGQQPGQPKRRRREKPQKRGGKGDREAAPRPADELKGSGAKLTEDEVAQWLELFGSEPNAEQMEEVQRAARQARRERRERRREKRRPPRPADRLKDSGAGLSDDEVEEWLDIFADDEDA